MNHVTTTFSEGVFEIIFDRAEKKNALTTAMYSALAAALDQAQADAAVRVVLIRGNGGVFTAGNDLGDFLANPPKDAQAPVFVFIDKLAFFPKPIVAAVDGLAVGLGTTLLLHCDLVLADPGTRFILPFVNLGLVPEAASTLLLPQRVGHVRAAEMLLLGQTFNAQTALECGLVNGVVTAGTVYAEAKNKALALARQPAASVRETKRLLKAPLETALRETLARETSAFLNRLPSPEAREAFAAFAEKRKPDFSRFA